MAGGDMRVFRQDPVGSSLGQIAIDCNSTKSGNMTEARDVNGKTAFFTQEGAAAYDGIQLENQFLGGGNKMKLESDPSWLSKMFFGDRKEHFVGQP